LAEEKMMMLGLSQYGDFRQPTRGHLVRQKHYVMPSKQNYLADQSKPL
jgi:hypothetical protein